MPDNWGFVAAAYGLAAFVLGGYWRYLRRRERELRSEGASTAPSELHNRRGPRGPLRTTPEEKGGGKGAARTGHA